MNPALARLTTLLPAPGAPEPTPDWESAEEQLSTTLPSDFKELIDTYGGGLIDNYMLLLEPNSPNGVYDLLDLTAQREEANAALWEFGDRPPEMEDGDNRLVCWGTTDNGEYLFWLVRPGDTADQRTIMINSASGEDWERYELTVTQFLLDILSGETRSDVLWSRFPQDDHEFRPARDQ